MMKIKALDGNLYTTDEGYEIECRLDFTESGIKWTIDTEWGEQLQREFNGTLYQNEVVAHHVLQEVLKELELSFSFVVSTF